jgi:hypothetical protein
MFLFQLQILGSELAKQEPGQLDSLMMTLRQKLTSTDMNNLSSQSRTHLILVLELFLLGWPKKLSDPVEAFYSKCLPKRGRCLQISASNNGVDDDVESQTTLSTTTDLFIGKSPMVEMNLAALAVQMSTLQQQQDEAATTMHGWCKDTEMWPLKTFARPPPQIINPPMSRPNLQGSLSLNDYSNLRPTNLRR